MQEKSMFLSEDEVIELTHKRYHSAQAKELRRIGVEHKIRADGSIAVLRSHAEKVFGETVGTGDRIDAVIEPNWSALDAKKT